MQNEGFYSSSKFRIPPKGCNRSGAKKVFLRQRGENAKKQDYWVQLLQICTRSQQFKKNRDSHQGKLQSLSISEKVSHVLEMKAKKKGLLNSVWRLDSMFSHCGPKTTDSYRFWFNWKYVALLLIVLANPMGVWFQVSNLDWILNKGGITNLEGIGFLTRGIWSLHSPWEYHIPGNPLMKKVKD